MSFSSSVKYSLETSLLIFQRLNLHYCAITNMSVENGLKKKNIIAIISGMIYRPAKFVIVTGLNMAQDNEAIKDNHTQSFGILKKYDLKKKVDTTE